MLASETSAASSSRQHQAREIEPGIRGLLDHIAVELAEEYVRLMEAAASNSADQEAAPNRIEENHRQ